MQTEPEPASSSTEVIQHVLAVAIVLGLLATSLLILRPFLTAILWATMIVVATWPLMLKAQARLGRRRWAATTTMTVVMLLVFVIPVSLAIGMLAENTEALSGWITSVKAWSPGEPPQWMAGVPLVSNWLEQSWRDFASRGELGAQLAPHLNEIGHWFQQQLGTAGAMTVQFLLTVIISALLYARGELAAAGLKAFMRRIAPRYGESSVVLAGQAIRAVAMGLVVTAVVQSLLGGIGLYAAGLPLAAILTALMFVLCLAQIGPAPVLVLSVAWLYFHDQTGWAIGLGVWSLGVMSLDNFLRPILIKRGADLPLVLIFAGVLGGLMAFGLVGLFVGPMVLAVTFRVGQAFSRETLAP